MLHLAENESKGFVSVGFLAEACKTPKSSLSQLVHRLSQHRLIKTQRGLYGGVKLAHPAEIITLLQIVNAVEGLPPEQEMCVLGLDACSDTAACTLHDQWLQIRELIQDTTLHQLTLGESVESLRQKRLEPLVSKADLETQQLNDVNVVIAEREDHRHRDRIYK